MRINATLASAAVALALATSPAAASKLTVTHYGRIIATLPWVVAYKTGMIKKAGLNIDGFISGSGGGSTLRNLLASDLPVGEVSTSGALAAARAGVKLKMIYAASNDIGELAWASKPGSGIKTIKDLAGKKIAFTRPKSITEMVVLHALKAEGLTGKVKSVALGGLGPALTALSAGAVAAAPLNDPRMTLHAKDYHIIFYARQYFPKISWAVGITTAKFAKAHPDVVRKIVEVHRKAVEYIYAHPAEVAKIYAKEWKVTLPQAKAILPKYYKWHHWNAGAFSKKGMLTMIDGLHSVGEMKGPVHWLKLIDQEFLPAGLHRKL